MAGATAAPDTRLYGGEMRAAVVESELVVNVVECDSLDDVTLTSDQRIVSAPHGVAEIGWVSVGDGLFVNPKNSDLDAE